MQKDIVRLLKRRRLLPLFDGEGDSGLAEKTAKGLFLAGLPVIEVALRSQNSIKSLRQIKKAFPNMLTGAGTVIDITQAKEAAKAGADFLVSPGLDERIARWSSGQSLPYFPGVATATEIQRALGLGIKTLKWFPASLLGGPPMLRAINGPFGFYGTAFIPTGGITRDNMVDYLREPNVIAVGGSFIMPEKLVIENSFEKAVNHTKSLLSLAKHG